MPEAPEGHYYGFIIEAQTCEPEKADGSPFIRITFHVPYFAGDGQWVEMPQPLQRDVLLSLSDKAWPYSEKKLEFLGFNGQFSTPEFQAQEGVELECSHQTRDGQTRERWDLANWGGGGGNYKSATEEVLMRLQQRWNQNKQAAQAPAGAPAPPPKPAATRPQPNGGQQQQTTQPKQVPPAQAAPPPMPSSLANAGDKEDDIPF